MQLVFGFDRWDRIVKFENNFNGFSFRRRRHSKNWTKKMLLSSSICCWQRGRLWSCGLSVCQQSLHTIYTEICTNIHTHTFEWEFSVYRLLRNRLGALTFSSGSFGMVFFSDKGIMFLKAHQHATNMNWEQPDNGPESQETTVLSSDCFSVCSIKSCASDSPTFLSHLQRKRVIHEVGNLILRIIALRFQQLSMISFMLIP